MKLFSLSVSVCLSVCLPLSVSLSQSLVVSVSLPHCPLPPPPPRSQFLCNRSYPDTPLRAPPPPPPPPRRPRASRSPAARFGNVYSDELNNQPRYELTLNGISAIIIRHDHNRSATPCYFSSTYRISVFLTPAKTTDDEPGCTVSVSPGCSHLCRMQNFLPHAR